MRESKWLRSVWDAIKGNVYYDVLTRLLVLICGSAILTTSWKWIQTIRGQSQLDPLGLTILGFLIFCTFLLIFIAFRNSRGGRDDFSPEFQFQIGTMLWTFDAKSDKTLFFPIARILNRGHPSVVANWNAVYKISGQPETMVSLWLRGPYRITMGEEILTIENSDLLAAKTAESPIPRGGIASGRLLFALPGDRSAQIKSLQHTLDFSCEDYLGNSYKATYRPSSEPVTFLLTLPHEKAEFKKQPLVSLTALSPQSEDE
jgi:hypothetical protein